VPVSALSIFWDPRRAGGWKKKGKKKGRGSTAWTNLDFLRAGGPTRLSTTGTGGEGGRREKKRGGRPGGDVLSPLKAFTFASSFERKDEPHRAAEGRGKGKKKKRKGKRGAPCSRSPKRVRLILTNPVLCKLERC